MTRMFTVCVTALTNTLRNVEAICDRCGQSYNTHVDAPKSDTPQHVNGERYGFIGGFLCNHACYTEQK